MLINSGLLQNNLYQPNKTSPSNKTYCFGLSFGAMKKREFSGLDLLCVEKFKAPIEKFNSNNDLQTWAFKKFVDFRTKDYSGRSRHGRVHRKVILRDWLNNICSPDSQYTNVEKVLILHGITKDLKKNTDKLPPIFNKEILADTLKEVKETKRSMIKTYNERLQNYIVQGLNVDKNNPNWIVLPSKKHNPSEFDKNVDRLKVLSCKTWCTKTYKARPYLENGDFHIYRENETTAIGIRFNDKQEIEEIQGFQNDWSVPDEYSDIIMEHIKSCKTTNAAKEKYKI